MKYKCKISIALVSVEGIWSGAVLQDRPSSLCNHALYPHTTDQNHTVVTHMGTVIRMLGFKPRPLTLSR